MPISPEDRDYMIRTVIGEASDQPDLGQAAVAHTIMNRTATGRWGDTPSKVVLARGQFEPWSTRAKELLRIKPDSKEYKRTSQIVDDVLSGKTPDPTQGSTHFLAPDIVRARRGGSLPDWASGQGITIGGHTFYAPEGRVQSPIAAQPGEGQALAFTPTEDDAALFKALGITLPPAQGAPRSVPGASAPAAAPAAPATPAGGMDPETKAILDGYGITLGGARPKTAPPEVVSPPENPLGPTLEEKAQKLARDPILGPGLTMRQGMPVAGPTLEAGGSAAAALVQPGDFATNYAQNQAVSRRVPQIYAQEHPWGATGFNALGAAGTYGPLAGTNAGRFAMGLPNRILPSSGGQFYSGIGGGAAINALDATMRGDDPLTGLAVGGASGALGAGGAWGLRAGVPFVRNALARPPAAMRDINPIARSWLVDAAQAGHTDNIGPLGFYGEQNPALTKIMQGISHGADEGSAVVRGAYDARGKTMFNELEGDLDKAFGGPRHNVVEDARLLTEERAKAADPLYEKWRNSEIVPTPELKKIMKDAGDLGLFATAEEHATLRNQAFNTKSKIIPAKEAGKFKKGWGSDPDTKYVHPATESWDMIKRALDARIDTAYGAGNKTLAADLISFKRRMTDEIEKQPAGQIWKQARAEFADKSALIDQIEAGRDTFLGSRSGLSVDELREELRHLSRPELMARIQGTRNAISDAMGDSIRGVTTTRDKLLAPNNREKLKLFLQDKADPLIEALEQKSTLAKKAQTVMGGSQTASNQEAVEALQAPRKPPRNWNILEPGSYLPGSVREELSPSNVFAARSAQDYAQAGNALAGKLTMRMEGPEAKKLRDSVWEEAKKRVAAQRLGIRLGNAFNSMVVAPSAETFRLRAYEPKKPLAIQGP